MRGYFLASNDLSRSWIFLIPRAQSGHRSAMGRLFEEHTRYLLTVITRLMGPELRRTLEPNDVLQETLLTAAARFGDFHGTKAYELRAWLAAMARRKLVDLARHNGRLKRALKGRLSLDEQYAPGGESVADLLTADSCTASQVAMKNELTGQLADALAQIDPQEAAVLRMRYSEGLSFDEIGRKIGTGRNAVRGLVARGLASLRTRLPA
jgi:RNA polymerase sigma-70 factor (ECF subfamily)